MATLRTYRTGGPGQQLPLDPTPTRPGMGTRQPVPPSTNPNPTPSPNPPPPPADELIPTNPGGPAVPSTPASLDMPDSPQGNVQSILDSFLSLDNPLMKHATQAGIDMANSRGMINSSIAAGNSRRATMDAVMPLVDQAMNVFNRREGEQFLLGRDRTQADLSNWLANEGHIRSLAAASHQAGLTDWLSNQKYTREFNGALSMLPIMNSFQLMQLIAQYAIQNPQTYPPGVVSGITNFLNQNMFSILKEYFPGLIAAGGNP